MRNTSFVTVLVAALVHGGLPASAQSLETEEQALVVYMQDNRGPLSPDTMKDVLESAVREHLGDQDVYILDRERRDLVKFNDLYPHFACVAAQPALDGKQSTKGEPLFVATAKYETKVKGLGYCPGSLTEPLERIDSIEVTEAEGYRWNSFESRMRDHLSEVQDAAENGHQMYVDICPRIHQYRAPVYARSWLRPQSEKLKIQIEDLAKEKAFLWLFGRLVDLKLDVRIGDPTLTLLSTPQHAAAEPERTPFNRIDVRVHTGPTGTDSRPCDQQDGFYGKANHFAFAPGQTLQALWDAGQHEIGPIPGDHIAQRRADLLAAFAEDALASPDSEVIYVIEGYESLEKKPSKDPSHAPPFGNKSKLSQDRALALMPFADEQWRSVATAGYGQTDVLANVNTEARYYFDKSIADTPATEDGKDASGQDETPQSDPEAVPANADATENAVEAVSDANAAFAAWGASPENPDGRQWNQTAFLSVFLVDREISPTRPNVDQTQPSHWLARAEAANLGRCINPEQTDHITADLAEMTSFFQNKQFAPYAEITGLQSAVIFVCSTKGALGSTSNLDAHQLASPFARALAATGKLNVESTRIGFLHSIKRRKTKDFYMFGNSLLTHFMPGVTTDSLRSVCSQHPSISINRDDTERSKVDLCVPSGEPHEIEAGALYHVFAKDDLEWIIDQHQKCRENLKSALPAEIPANYSLPDTKNCLGAVKNPLPLFEALKSDTNVFRTAIDVAFTLSDRPSPSR